jgi:hypothetical protein
MSDTPQTETPEEPTNQPAPQAQQVIPLLLTAQEINTLVVLLRKFPMEQIEGLVGNIRMQFNNFVVQTQTPKE